MSAGGGGWDSLRLHPPHFNMFKFTVADVQTVVAEAQGNRSLGDFVAARVGESVPSEVDENDTGEQSSSAKACKGKGKGKRSSAAMVEHCTACDNPRKSGSTWCLDHKRCYDTIYKATRFQTKPNPRSIQTNKPGGETNTKNKQSAREHTPETVKSARGFHEC